MYRTGLDFIKNWRQKEGRKPLLIRGARQVGKSYLVQEFARMESCDLLEINFEKEPDAAELFQKQSIQKTCTLLELQYKTRIDPRKTILFLDEIQSAPQVIPILRYFYEERPDLCVIAAGSLLEFVLADHSFSMPVGRLEYMYLGPLTFEEFLLACGEADLKKFIDELQPGDALPSPIHRRLMDRIRTFCVIGGMPEVINAFLKTSWQECEAVKQNILSTYQDDFSKYRGRMNDTLLRKVFQKVPLLIGEKIKYVNIDPHERSKDLSQGLDLLCMARVAHRVYHSSANGVPLGAEINQKIFKTLFLDIGLVSSSCGLSLLDFEKQEDLNFVNEGRLAEQFVGQHLLYDKEPYHAPEIHYWVREKRNASAEVDYVTSLGPQVIPIEVKSGKTGSLRSLHLFLKEKEGVLGIRFNTDPMILHREGEIQLLSLPFYLVGQWRRLARLVLTHF